MKNFTIILSVLIAMSIKTNAQITNSGFENWTTVGSYEDPTGWVTFNSYSAGSFYAVTKSTDHYPATVGSYSVKIQSDTSLLLDYSALGILMTDNMNDDPAFPITGHPNSLMGYYKFAPQNGDTMRIYISLYNDGTEVSSGNFITAVSASEWTSFNLPIPDYVTADSGFIMIASYNSADAPPEYIPNGNSVLYIDNLSFDSLITSTSTSIANLSTKNTLFNIYPNPASDIVTLNIDNRNNADLTLNIYNSIGELVRSELLKQNQQKINIGDLNNGIYIFEIKSKEWSENQKLIIRR